ncbi:MAG: hypothetical protein QQN63_00530 [Nitrosopumilus sp.]
MMIAVLIDSRKIGSSGWINVRSTQAIRVRGMQGGDQVLIHWGSDGIPLEVLDDGEFPVNDEINVKAEIVKVSEGSRIYVDLE